MRNITIYGDGIIGKLTALSLSDFFNVYIVSEKSKTDSKEAGERYFSINLLSKFMFEKHGLCESLNKKDCYGYSQIITWDKLLTENVSFDSSEISFDKLGYIIKESNIKESLDEKLKGKKNIYILSIKDIDKINQLNSQFIIKSSFLKEKISFKEIDYSQKAIVLNLTIDKAIDRSIAYQRFDVQQIQGLLPIAENQYNLIWSAKNTVIKSLYEYDDDKMISILNEQLKDQVGKVIDISERSTYPLSGFNAKKYILDNSVLIGGAAHAVHPLAGLGLNMGIQDIYILRRSIETEESISTALEKYEKTCYLNNSRFFNTINFLVEFYMGGKIPDKVRSQSLSFFNKNTLLKNKIIEVATGIDALKSESKDKYCKPCYK